MNKNLSIFDLISKYTNSICYEHVRTDNWEKETAEQILKNQTNEYFAPVDIRPLASSLEEVLSRISTYPMSLKEDNNRIIIKCEKTECFTQHTNPRIGKLQKLKILEVIDKGNLCI